jgi:hypothetical protein
MHDVEGFRDGRRKDRHREFLRELLGGNSCCHLCASDFKDFEVELDRLQNRFQIGARYLSEPQSNFVNGVRDD